MSQITVSNLTFAYDGSYDNIFENVSFTLDTDWKLGFTGRNGRGKTTFLNLLMGKYEYAGTISASVGFDYFPFDAGNPEQLTSDIIAAIAPDVETWRLTRELSLLNIDENTLWRPFCTLSNGERTKVLLAALFLKENNFLLIDEPTNHLDAEARVLVSEYLNSKRGFILVSHDRSFLDHCVDHILSINKANIEIQRGNFSSWQENKRMQDEFEQNENEKLKKDIKKLSTAAKRTAKWSDKVESTKIGSHVPDRGAVGHKAAKMMKRSKAIEARREAAAAEKSKLLKNIENADALSIKPLEHHSGTLVTLDELSISYSGRVIFKNVSFAVKNGDRVALTGRNGCGKSSVLKLILGEDIEHSGTVRTASGLVISYVSQDTSELCGNLRDFALKCGIDESLFKAILRKLGFSRVQFEKDISEFSGGQKKKTLIAKSLCEQAHLYIWDEPLNFIDVLSRIQIEELILAHKPSMLFVEHDSAFVKAVSTGIINVGGV